MIDDVLDALIDAAGPDGPPVWGAFRGPHGDPYELDLHPEPSDLFGATAPPDVWAVGTVAAGTAWHLDGEGPDRRCRVAFVLDRDGRSASRLWLGDEVLDGPPGEPVGRVPDTMRRVLGLPTEAAGTAVGVALGIEWLANLGAVADEVGTLDWSFAAALHPVAPTMPAVEPTATELAAEVATWSWAEVRAGCEAGSVHLCCVPPPLAGWMDDGMLCRWVLGEHPDVRAVVRSGLAAVPAADRHRVMAVATGRPAGPPARRPRRRGR